MQKRTILAVEDDQDLLYIEERVLVKAGYNVLCAQNIARALQFIMNDTPDLLLLDINLPTGNGMNIHERLRATTALRNIPVIYVTGERSQSALLRAQEMDAFAVIYKPISLDNLLTHIQTAFENAILSRGNMISLQVAGK